MDCIVHGVAKSQTRLSNFSLFKLSLDEHCSYYSIILALSLIPVTAVVTSSVQISVHFMDTTLKRMLWSSLHIFSTAASWEGPSGIAWLTCRGLCFEEKNLGFKSKAPLCP